MSRLTLCLASGALFLCLAFAVPARALQIIFTGGPTIVDNGLGDTNLATGIINFNTTVGNYLVTGDVDTGSGPNMSQLIGSPSASIRLTNFTAEAVGTPTSSLDINFSDTAIGVFTGIQGADSLDAYVGHVSGAPVPAATDVILQWQGFVSGLAMTPVNPGPPPYFNPFLPASSAPLPYSIVSHGPSPLPGVFNNPILGAMLSLQLGAPGDQLILFTSAEVAFAPVPEPSSFVLLGMGLAGLAMFRRKQGCGGA